MYVGNLSFSATEADLRSLFAEAGQVAEVAIILDRESGRPRGFGFVSMSTKEEMDNAVRLFNGRDHQGRALTVNEAQDRAERPAYGNSGSRGNQGGRDQRSSGGGARY
jgi:cold-inducible RNA-binding protein